MMSLRSWTLGILVVVGLTATATLSLADQPPEGTMCPVSEEAVDAEVTADYRGATVYFCCEDCQKSFHEDPAKYAGRANLQLVMTKQFEQKACPLTGRPKRSDKTVAIEGVDVQFCCGNCLKKVEGADDDGKVKLAFEDAAFDKGFEKAK